MDRYCPACDANVGVEPFLGARAMVAHLSVRWTELEAGYDETRFEYGTAEYWVLTDGEADTQWDEAFDSYIDELSFVNMCPRAESINGVRLELLWSARLSMPATGPWRRPSSREHLDG